MENISLTSKEKKELEKRGFYVKEMITFTDFSRLFLLYIGIIFGVLGVTGWIFLFLNISYASITVVLSLLIPVFFLLRATFFYILIGKSFFSHNGIIAFGNESEKQLQEKYLNYIQWSLRFEKNNKNVFFNSHPGIVFTGIMIGLILWVFLSASNNISGIQFLLIFFFIILSILIYPTLSYFLRLLVEHFHPLYAFGNLGMKIQELTPEISEQSQLIQSEFQKDQNFGVLRSVFEKLGETFSEIVSLVIKLEKIEARVNKGNFFDSKKYIDSLRSDVVTPLVELKGFLEKQRDELIKSQKELSRVKVGGDISLEENKELQSKRSEELLQELDTNIIKLGEMIGKMV